MLQVILLIYEYTIAVESSVVQKHVKEYLLTNNSKTTEDHPIADKLDRGYFGFDQESFERMPLLINAMQENSYIDSSPDFPVDIKNKNAKYLNLNNYENRDNDKIVNRHGNREYKSKPIRRTSPRPFIFEYRSPTPTPFINTHNYNSRNWIDSYHNAQRLKNLEQVIKYLEKTINAKFGDLYALPSNTHIAFSGVYVEPTKDDLVTESTSTTESTVLITPVSKVNLKREPTLNSDPLFTFKPDNPGDVNLLAEQSLRFSPYPTANVRQDDKWSSKIPMFRPIPKFKQDCIGTRCVNQHNDLDKKILEVLHGSSENVNTQVKPKSFGLMLNLFPFQRKRQDIVPNTHSILDSIYLTTSKPKLQFRRKTSLSSVRSRPKYYPRHKHPRTLFDNKSNLGSHYLERNEETEQSTASTNMVVHLNVYPTSKIHPENFTSLNRSNVTLTDHDTTTVEVYKNKVLTTNSPITQQDFEDFHASPSDNIETKIEPTISFPKVTTMIPILDTSRSWSTNQPEILKFSHEDARVPNQYFNFGARIESTTMNIPKIEEVSIIPETVTDNMNDMGKLILKLKNRLETTTDSYEVTTEKLTTEATESQTPSTIRTYVPQINGHYRSINQNSRNINNWLDEKSNKKATRRLETIRVIRRPVYVEIQRKSSKSSEQSV